MLQLKTAGLKLSELFVDRKYLVKVIEGLEASFTMWSDSEVLSEYSPKQREIIRKINSDVYTVLVEAYDLLEQRDRAERDSISDEQLIDISPEKVNSLSKKNQIRYFDLHVNLLRDKHDSISDSINYLLECKREVENDTCDVVKTKSCINLVK